MGRVDSSKVSQKISIHVIVAVFLLSGCGDESAEPAAASDFRTTTQALDGETWEPSEHPMVLGPPYIPGPLYACTGEVEVGGCVEDAEVRVQDGNGNLLGTGYADKEGKATVKLDAPGSSYKLAPQTTITAIQEVTTSSGTYTSDPSQPRTVTTYDRSTLPTMRISENVWECGGRIATEGSLPSMQVHLLDGAGTSLETDWSTKKNRDGYLAMFHQTTPEGTDGEYRRVKQVYCPEESYDTRVESTESDAKQVKTAPDPMPTIGKVEAIEGTEVVRIIDTYMGSLNEYYESGTKFGQHRGSRTTYWFPYEDQKEITSSTDITATQELCKESSSVTAEHITSLTGLLEAPQIIEPVCPGASVVRVKPAMAGGRLMLEHNSTEISHTAADTGEPTRMGIPPSVSLSSGDPLTAYQVARSGKESPQHSVQVSSLVPDSRC